MTHIKHLIIGLLTVFSSLSSAQENSEINNLIGGSVTELYPSTVFALLGPAKCTSTKIAPRTYITAAHCLTSRTPGKTEGKIKRYLSKGDPIFISVKPLVKEFKDLIYANIQDIYIHPSYDFYSYEYAVGNMDDFKSAALSLDVAVFTIAKELESVPVAELSFDHVRINQSFSMIGYGCEDSFKGQSSKTGYIGRKKVGHKFAGTVFGDPSLTFLDEFIRQKLDDNYIYSDGIMEPEPKASICSGDSGGPIYINNKVSGVISFAYATDEGEAYNNFFTRIEETEIWIQSILEL
jgi:secreted trypsin-like serine protease